MTNMAIRSHPSDLIHGFHRRLLRARLEIRFHLFAVPLHILALEEVALFLEDLQPFDLLHCQFIPPNSTFAGDELKLQDSLQRPPCGRAMPHFFKRVQRAWEAALDCDVVRGLAVRAESRSVRVVREPGEVALRTPDPVG